MGILTEKHSTNFADSKSLTLLQPLVAQRTVALCNHLSIVFALLRALSLEGQAAG